jgi:class 3 adenylate cyclase
MQSSAIRVVPCSGVSALATKANDTPIRVAELSADEVEGERKTVTALFADIKGSTELEQDLDPEDARAIIDPALKIMIAAARHYDGYVQNAGDGIFALFGAPRAYEDHPQRAVHAALRMQQEIRRYGDQLLEAGRVPIEIRVGVNTGGGHAPAQNWRFSRRVRADRAYDKPRFTDAGGRENWLDSGE